MLRFSRWAVAGMAASAARRSTAANRFIAFLRRCSADSTRKLGGFAWGKTSWEHGSYGVEFYCDQAGAREGRPQRAKARHSIVMTLTAALRHPKKKADRPTEKVLRRWAG